MALAADASFAVGDLSVLASSWRRALRAQNKSPRTVDGYLEGVRLFDDYLARMGMPRAVAHIRREQASLHEPTPAGGDSTGVLIQDSPRTFRPPLLEPQLDAL